MLGPQLHVLGGDERSVGEHHRFLDAVLELPDVAGPAEMPDGVERLAAEALDLGGELARRAGEEELGEHERVVAPLAQGRQVQVHDVHAVVEVLAEPSGIHLRFQVLVGGGDDADVDRLALRLSYAGDGALLEGPQELHL